VEKGGNLPPDFVVILVHPFHAVHRGVVLAGKAPVPHLLYVYAASAAAVSWFLPACDNGCLAPEVVRYVTALDFDACGFFDEFHGVVPFRFSGQVDRIFV